MLEQSEGDQPFPKKNLLLLRVVWVFLWWSRFLFDPVHWSKSNITFAWTAYCKLGLRQQLDKTVQVQTNPLIDAACHSLPYIGIYLVCTDCDEHMGNKVGCLSHQPCIHRYTNLFSFRKLPMGAGRCLLFDFGFFPCSWLHGPLSIWTKVDLYECGWVRGSVDKALKTKNH